ncbi:SMP-30/gluconolactonase/LRE family protein [Pseudodonghicola xiamenensis]|uniref:Gluconolactonase n=1 Tax=Pseudodonghicola xiamenensis TaxID=337702 RepID=A0A8J3H877_9RHOB|nr:SMP-30/gluconolactonase/LRE family protein [Pseudodonghicola xiamenensis]GHG97640.1 gluconolactonase [Pseudodonghicola xiamenensis]
MTPPIFDDRICTLGEGPLWHPLRQQLFWFDIVNNRLLSRNGDRPLEWRFDRHVSAAGWIDEHHLLIASETDLFRFDLENGQETRLCALEADRPETRSNDGRADPWGGFWIGTMGKGGETGAGTLYRWYRGELRPLLCELTTPNAICFAPDRSCAYYSDTKARTIWRQPLAADTGWPQGERQVFLDLHATDQSPEYKPDGAVTDSEGCLWSAQWGAARVARYAPDGRFLEAVALPTGHTSCPAFGGPDLGTLFVTSATQKLPEDRPDWQADAGRTFALPTRYRGSPEPRVIC